MSATFVGMKVLVSAAINELSRVDPGNHLNVQNNRQRILDAARDEALRVASK